MKDKQQDYVPLSAADQQKLDTKEKLREQQDKSKTVGKKGSSFSFKRSRQNALHATKKGAEYVAIAAASSPIITIALSVLAIASTPFTGPAGLAVGIAGIMGVASAITTLGVDYAKTKKIDRLEKENTLLSAARTHKLKAEVLVDLYPGLKDVVAQKNDKLMPHDVRTDATKASHKEAQQLPPTPSPPPPTTIIGKIKAKLGAVTRATTKAVKYTVAKYGLQVASLVCTICGGAVSSMVMYALKSTATAVAVGVGAAIDAKAKHSTVEVCDTLKTQIRDMKKDVHGYNNVQELETITRKEYIKTKALEALLKKPDAIVVEKDGKKETVNPPDYGAMLRNRVEMSTDQVKGMQEKFNALVDQFDKSTSVKRSPSGLEKAADFVLDVCRGQHPLSNGNNPSVIRQDPIPSKSTFSATYATERNNAEQLAVTSTKGPEVMAQQTVVPDKSPTLVKPEVSAQNVESNKKGPEAPAQSTQTAVPDRKYSAAAIQHANNSRKIFVEISPPTKGDSQTAPPTPSKGLGQAAVASR